MFIHIAEMFVEFTIMAFCNEKINLDLFICYTKLHASIIFCYILFPRYRYLYISSYMNLTSENIAIFGYILLTWPEKIY